VPTRYLNVAIKCGGPSRAIPNLALTLIDSLDWKLSQQFCLFSIRFIVFELGNRKNIDRAR